MQDSKNRVIILQSEIFKEKPKNNSCEACGSTTKKCRTVAQAALCNNYIKPKKTNNESKNISTINE